MLSTMLQPHSERFVIIEKRNYEKKHKKPLSALAFEYESMYKTFAMWPNFVEIISRCHESLWGLIAQFLELFGRKLAEL